MIEGVTNPMQAATPPAEAGATPAAQPARAAQHAFEQGDAVELSATAREHLERSGQETIREGLVERVRAEIAAGTYLTDDKIDAVVDRLLAKVITAA